MFIGILASLASAAVGAMGAIQQGQAASAAAKYNAEVQRQNAQVAQDQAARVASDKIRQNNQQNAVIVAGSAENGFELTGSPLALLGQSERQGAMDYLSAIYDGRVAATGYLNNAKLYDMEAKNAQTASVLGAGSALLGGVSGAYDVYRTSQMSV